ncbi:hypothetical protein L1987_46028 [Smallanthus sonchifolius]|uniref:Uncharacterized protein n=1 Tax=Smallanthus sonchifolius TaxID=185202 RepID=A0ACB9FYP6_9ASTR|nr:hypothetical protein L1987_46028 [Smallanthus sonchifolius]
MEHLSGTGTWFTFKFHHCVEYLSIDLINISQNLNKTWELQIEGIDFARNGHFIGNESESSRLPEIFETKVIENSMRVKEDANDIRSLLLLCLLSAKIKSVALLALHACILQIYHMAERIRAENSDDLDELLHSVLDDFHTLNLD